jgi:hypothetical protein
MTKLIPQHLDKLGRPIFVESCVAFPGSNCLYIGKVIKLNPKMIGVETLGSRGSKYNKYPQDCVLVNEQDVTMAILKGQL